MAMLTRQGCSMCAEAKRLLSDAGVEYVEIDLPTGIRTRALGAIADAGTVPQVFINGQRIGGLGELRRRFPEVAKHRA